MADWTFQSNPKRYDVHATVAASRQDWWNTPRYRDRIELNDRVWLQVIGPDQPGIYYIATITSLPTRTLTPYSGSGRPTSGSTIASTRRCYAPTCSAMTGAANRWHSLRWVSA